MARKGFDFRNVADLRDLEGYAEGDPALILGGGPSLPEQFKRAPDGVRISVNQHGLILTECDAVVMLDRKPYKHCRQFDVPIFSPRRDFSDVQLTACWIAPNSAMTAVWVADFLGCSPIILLGIDCYADGRTYFWDEQRYSAGAGACVRDHVESWRKVKKNVLGHYKVRVMGGPLQELFPLYRPGEIVEMPEEIPKERPKNQRYIHCLRATRAGNMTVEQGGCYWVHMDHAAVLVGMGKAEYAEPPKPKKKVKNVSRKRK